jgi:hypothetical protein
MPRPSFGVLTKQSPVSNFADVVGDCFVSWKAPRNDMDINYDDPM